MIGLPVAGVTAADVLIRTENVSTREGLDRELGSADARVYVESRRPVAQTPDRNGFAVLGREPRILEPPTAATVATALGSGAHAVRVVSQPIDVRTPNGLAGAEAFETDLGDPVTHGSFPLASGRYPQTAGEVVVSEELVARGVGDRIEPLDGEPRAVVGVVRSLLDADETLVAGMPGGLGIGEPVNGGSTFLVAKPGGVSWADVQSANRQALTVLSRQVVEDPPPASEVDPRVANAGDGVNGDEAAFVALIVVMALLEVVLLAGPAFAVGTRQKAQTLAMMVAGGGATPADLRRTVLASGVVLGAGGALIGAGVGVGVAALIEPLLQDRASQRFGPFEVAPLDLAGIAGFGLLSAVLAAVAPAWLASRQDVVATLGGRRGDPPPSRRFPVAGLGLLVVGVLVAASGARAPSGEAQIAVATVIAVVGMVLLLPAIVSVLGRTARALPLPARFAVRDAARHRNRTAPAIAAIMATVVGVTALSITTSSDARERELTYSPVAPPGAGLIQGAGASAPWDRAAAAAERAVPGATVRPVRGIGFSSHLRFVGVPTDYSTTLGTSVPVLPGGVAGLRLPIARGDVARADAILARGGAVVFSRGRPDAGPRVTLAAGGRRVTVPAVRLDYSGTYAPATALLSPAAARKAGVTVKTRALLVSGTKIDAGAEKDLTEAVRGVSSQFSAYVERGFREYGTDQGLVLAILGGVGALLMLGGSLTASSLALSDARPDLATLAAVGAPPRTRRLIAAAYAGSLALVGALLGTALGFVPGVAASHSLTASSLGAYRAPGSRLPDDILVVPWPLLAAVFVALPLLTAAVAGLTSRSRLPTTARLT